MAASSTRIATADCDVVDTKTSSDSQPEPIQLCMFMPPLTAAESISRTARYAADPTAYLRSALGEARYDEQKGMLSIPETVDKDAYGKGTHKQQFEKHIAQNILGKQFGLFFLTGVQAQLAALKIWCERAGKKRVAWHVSSHLESAEERSFEALYGLERMLLGSDPEALPTVEEIKALLKLPPNKQPAVIVIELPNRVLGCKTYSFQELEQISLACKEADVALHIDGARLWEIEPYYQATAGKTFRDLVGLFGSVYVSFYKGLGGVAGAMLVHDDESFINAAKVWQRRAGGNAFTLMYEVIECERGFNENIGTFARKREKMMGVVERITQATEQFRTGKQRRIVSFVPEQATCCQVHTLFQGYTAAELEQARDRVQNTTRIRVFERLKQKESLDDKMKAERGTSAREEDKEQDEDSTAARDDKRHFMEWMMMSVTEKLETEVFVDGYVALCKELLGAAMRAS